jgi:hypothetical protein
VILIIPTVYRRPHVKQLVSLLLLSMRFAACFPLQEKRVQNLLPLKRLFQHGTGTQNTKFV